MSDSEKELDEVNFSDGVFFDLYQNPAQRGGGGQVQGGKRNAETMTVMNQGTVHRFYREAGTT